MAANKVKFGLSKVAYALVTETTTSGVTTSSYGTIKELKGAVNLSLSNDAEKNVFRADNEDYFISYGQGSYSGDLEVARVNEDFLKDVLGYAEDDDKILVESAASVQQTTYFALLFQFEGDQHSTDPQTETLTITAVPRADADKYIHLQTQDTTSTAVVAAWYTAVPTPTFS